MVDGVQEGVDGYMKTWIKEGGSSDRHFRVVDNGKKSKQLEMKRWSTTSLDFSEKSRVSLIHQTEKEWMQ